jgi:DNA mismatch endonuclease, patch repair protein
MLRIGRLLMADIVSPDVRSRMMAGIRGKDTKPEMLIRRGLHARGFRYVLHDKRLPGKPDLVLPKYEAVVFVHGCFWHGHDCHLFKWPKTKPGFWRKKIERNQAVDAIAQDCLEAAGWRQSVVWECALKGVSSIPISQTISELERWLYSQERSLVIKGI